MSTQTKINFITQQEYVYAGVYTSDNKLLSSNYFNDVTTRTDNYLTLQNGVNIIFFYYDSVASLFYVTNIVKVSDISKLPTTNIILNVNTSNILTSANAVIDLSTAVNNVLNLGVYSKTVNSYVSLLSDDDTIASNCLNDGNVIFGDAAMSSSPNTTYYSSHNICVDIALLNNILSFNKSSSSSNDSGWETFKFLITFILLFVLATIVAAVLEYLLDRKYK